MPSPSGFSIPSIPSVTPLHQPEEDQQIIGNNPYYAPQNIGPSHSMMTGSSGSMGMGGMSSGMGSSSDMVNMGLPLLMNTPTKFSSYQPSYATPHSMMQPQTPVSIFHFI